jgi:hypothetical protein
LRCYFQGCNEEGENKEHIPPKCFFPLGEKEQLMTVYSCKEHNNAKSKDDLYVLAQICMNASPSNRSREVWESTVVPQLEFNNGALRKKLAAGSEQLSDGSVKYKVDVTRMDSFFCALSCGIVYRACNAPLPINYSIGQIYHNFVSERDPEMQALEAVISKFYAGRPMDVMAFGEPGAKNERIYTATIFGVPGYTSSITIVHMFFGTFRVTSMLTRLAGNGQQFI